MKNYICKKTGQRVEAIRCVKGLEYSELPPGFGENVNDPESFVCRNAKGKLGDWLVKWLESGNFDFVSNGIFEKNFIETLCQGGPPPDQPPELDTKAKAALDFELELNELVNKHIQGGLTITHAVGTLNLCAADIAHQFFHKR